MAYTVHGYDGLHNYYIISMGLGNMKKIIHITPNYLCINLFE